MRKKLLLVSATLVLAATLVKAQPARGNFLLGGDLSFNRTKATYSTNNYETTTSSFSFRPAISYFITNRIALGLITPLSLSHNSQPTTQATLGSSTQRSYSVGPNVRYYIPFGQWAFFPFANYSMGWSHFEGPRMNISSGLIERSASRGKLNTFQAGAGATYFVAENIGVEALLYHQQLSNEIDDGTMTTDFSSLSLSVGLQIYLNRN